MMAWPDDIDRLVKIIRLQIAINIVLVGMNIVWLIHVWFHG